MATTKQRRDYTRRLNAIIREAAQASDATGRALMLELNSLRLSVSELLQVPGAVDITGMTELLAAIDQQILATSTRMGAIAASGASEQWILGAQSVHAPFIAAEVTAGAFIGVNTQQLIVLRGFTVDLITRLSDEMKDKIKTRIQIGALGGKSPFDIMRDVTDILGIKGGREIVGGVASRAEGIVKTELGRVFSSATQAQLEQTAASVDDMRKRWLASGNRLMPRDAHIAEHMQTLAEPIPHDKPFMINGHALMFPRDPSAPAGETIRCGCRHIAVHPDLGIISGPFDKAIEKQQQVRAEA